MGKRYVSFSLAGARYGIPVDQVMQILRLENLIEVPKPPPYVEGVINLKGDIVPVVSLRTRLEIGAGGRAPSPDPRKRRVVVVRLGSRQYGLDVDEVNEIVDIDESGISRDATTVMGMRAELILGIARRADALYLVLDLPRVLGGTREVPGAPQGQNASQGANAPQEKDAPQGQSAPQGRD
ncbi:MAG TPA: chemotaxis protein CheW [Spirochaetia bacterium]